MSNLFCRLGVASLLLLFGSLAEAQAVPTPAQAQQMLRTDPTLITRLQQMMLQSGLTPEQVRDRLKAQGYPDDLLDQYLPGARPDTTLVPGDNVFAAVRALGFGDSLAIDSMRAAVKMRQKTRNQVDSAFLDTLQRALKNDSTANAIRAILKSRDLQRQQLDSGFKIFGLDLFAEGSNLFEASATGAADPNYRFGTGDQLTLILTGDIQRTIPLTVNHDGFVVVPDVGRVDVAGKTRSQLEDALYRQLGRVYSGVRRDASATTRFYIDVAQVGANQIFVNGDVRHPASYRVSRAGTVMTALYMAGGPTENGSMRNVMVRRNGQVIGTLDVYDYALRGDASRDIRLENGDIVFVPPRGGQARVAGFVLRPATYEVKSGETVADLIRMAGGFAESADARRLQIQRIVPATERGPSGSDRKVIDVPAELFATAPILGGDLVVVHDVAKRVGNQVKVLGNVWSAGPLGFTPGMTLYDALRRAGGLKPDSYLGQVLVSRLRADSTREMLRTAVFDTVGRPVENLRLADGDEVTVFSTTEFRPTRYITVGGAVRKPGRVPFAEGMTLRDAVLLAGGLQEGALLSEAEVARLPESRAAGVTATTRTVALDSSYLFERGVDGRVFAPPGVAVPRSSAPPVVLQPYDAILIKRQPEWQLQQSVSVQGEVRYPGDYSITRKTETLSDIIARAGGLTEAAYAGGIVFVRKRGSIGRIGVDLPAVLRDSGYVDNLQLVDGDSVFIPRFAPVVTVRGSVNSPVGVAYVAGADLDYYVRSAGGPTPKGDERRAYVTQPNGKVEARYQHWYGSSYKPKPQPGSTVVVPEKDPADRRDWAQIATTVTSILGSLVAIFAIVKR